MSKMRDGADARHALRQCAYERCGHTALNHQTSSGICAVAGCECLQMVEDTNKAPTKKEDEQTNVIDWPKHYNQGKIQMTDYVVDQRMGWLSGNIIKYVVRSRHKGSRLLDLKKALWYLQKLIRVIEDGGEE